MCGFIAQLVEQSTDNAEVTGSNPVEALMFFSGFFFPIPEMIVYKRVNRQEKSLRHIAMVAKFLNLNKLWSGTNTCTAHGCHQGQNCSPYFSSIIHECNLPSRNIVTCEIKKFCYHGNMMLHFSSLLNYTN